MKQLLNPILRDALRVIERSPDCAPAFKARLSAGLADIDIELQVAAAIQTDRAIPKPKKESR